MYTLKLQQRSIRKYLQNIATLAGPIPLLEETGEKIQENGGYRLHHEFVLDSRAYIKLVAGF